MSLTTSALAKRLAVVLTVGAAAMALTGCSILNQVTGPIDVNPSDGTDTDVFSIKVGDCLNDGNLEGQVTTTPVIDCAEPHDSEAYASVLVADGEYPGDQAIFDQADTECGAAFATYVGIDWSESSLNFSYYYPTTESWANGDREILCLVYDPAGQTTGSLKDAAR